MVFFTGDNNIDISDGTYEMNYKNTADRLIELSNCLDDKGIRLVFCSVPSKVSIYPEYLPGNLEPIDTPSDLLEAEIDDRGNITYWKAKRVLLDEKERGKLYYRTDTHWNNHGVYVGYCDLSVLLNRKFGINAKVPEVASEPNIFSGDLDGMMGTTIIRDNEKYEDYEILNRKSTVVLYGSELEDIKSICRKYDYSDVCLYKNEHDHSGKTVLVFGDSFFCSAGRDAKMVDYLAENCQKLVYVWGPYVIPELVEYVAPDVVIYEKGERELKSLAYWSEKSTQLFKERE